MQLDRDGIQRIPEGDNSILHACYPEHLVVSELSETTCYRHFGGKKQDLIPVKEPVLWNPPFRGFLERACEIITCELVLKLHRPIFPHPSASSGITSCKVVDREGLPRLLAIPRSESNASSASMPKLHYRIVHDMPIRGAVDPHHHVLSPLMVRALGGQRPRT